MSPLSLLVPPPLGSLDWRGLVLETALKATLLLGLAALANLLLLRASAALRHWVWSTALTAVLLLPAALLVLPDWSLRGVRFPAVKRPVATMFAMETRSLLHTATRSSMRDVAPTQVPAPRASDVDPTTQPSRVKAAELRTSLVTGTPVSNRRPGFASVIQVMIPVLWLLGTMIALLPMLAGRLALRRLASRSRPPGPEEWHGMADEAAHTIGLRRAVTLLESDQTAMPLTWGIRRPCVLLPAVARSWPIERLRAVLLHEMAHVRRWDCFTQMLAQLACAVLWFHPGVWYASRRLRIERERACDDHVLNAATRASEYAGHLLDVVRSLRDLSASPFGAVAFARPSQFEGRLLAVLDPRRRRNALGLGPALRIAVVSVVLLAALAALKPWASVVDAGETHREAFDATHSRLVGGASEVVRAPDASQSLESRWAWAKAEADRRGAPGDYWVGYVLPRGSGRGDGILCDSEGIDLAILDDSYRGPTLAEVLAGQTGGRPAKERRKAADPRLAVLLHVTRQHHAGGQFDRLRAQTLSLPAEIGHQPLFWLGESTDDQSIAWLREIEKQLDGSPLREQVVSIIGLHEKSEAVVPYLRGLVEGQGRDEVRAEAAEGLSGHPGLETLELLSRTARLDRSLEVRMRAVESLGRLQMEKATKTLLDIARSRDDLEVRRTAVEALGRRAAEATPLALEALVQPETPAAVGVPREAPVPVEPAAPCRTPAVSASDAPTPELAPPEEQEEQAPQAEREKMRHPRTKAEFDPDEVEVQRQAVESLGRMGEAVSLRRLMSIAKTHPVPEVRRQAVESIGQLATDGALSALVDIAWKNPDPDAQRQAVESMQRFPEEKAVPRLINVARSHPNPDVRRQALETLCRFPGSGAVQFLREMATRDPDPDIQRQAIEAFAHLPDEIGLPVLTDLARTHPRSSMRREAIEWLAQKDPDRALPVIEEILRKPPKKQEH